MLGFGVLLSVIFDLEWPEILWVLRSGRGVLAGLGYWFGFVVCCYF